MEPSPVREELLLRRHLGGDAQAFPELVRRRGPMIYGLLGRFGFSPQERDDVFQEVLVRVHRAAATFRPGRALKPWLLAITMNTARSALGRRAARAAREDSAREERSVSPAPSGPQVLEASETLGFITSELDRLPASQRDSLLLCAVNGLSAADAAEVLGAPVATVKTNLRRGRIALARALERRDATQSRELDR